jgi:hypothetical protein
MRRNLDETDGHYSLPQVVAHENQQRAIEL